MNEEIKEAIEEHRQQALKLIACSREMSKICTEKDLIAQIFFGLLKTTSSRTDFCLNMAILVAVLIKQLEEKEKGFDE